MIAFFGSVKIALNVFLSNGFICVRTGSLPIISGISPNSFKSLGIIYCNILEVSKKLSAFEALYPTACIFKRFVIARSIPSNAPPAIKSIFSVLTSINFWSGCFLPPLGGTLTTVPSNNFRSPCCTPSPETSLVIDGLSPLRAILSISSINTIPLSAFSRL